MTLDLAKIAMVRIKRQLNISIFSKLFRKHGEGCCNCWSVHSLWLRSRNSLLLSHSQFSKASRWRILESSSLWFLYLSEWEKLAQSWWRNEFQCAKTFGQSCLRKTKNHQIQSSGGKSSVIHRLTGSRGKKRVSKTLLICLKSRMRIKTFLFLWQPRFVATSS